VLYIRDFYQNHIWCNYLPIIRSPGPTLSVMLV